MQISAMRPYLEGPGEPVHQSVNSRNKSDISAGVGDVIPGYPRVGGLVGLSEVSKEIKAG